MDELINDTKVMEVLILKVPKASLNKKRKIKMREAFRQNFCVGVPKSMAVDIIPPKAKRQRQCTKDLARDAYIEKTSTDSFSEEDRTRLLIFNKLSSLPAKQKLQDPLSMSDARFPKNVYVRKQLRWYCEDVLEIVSPGHGKELYEYINDLDIQYVNQKIQKTLNVFVDNLMELFLYGKNCCYQRLDFVELCGALTFNELNMSFVNRRKFGGSQSDLLWKNSAQCPRQYLLIKRSKYNTGGTLTSQF
jgi:hypothetical protein